MKKYLQYIVQILHSFLLNSSISRAYVACVVAPDKIKKVKIHGTKIHFHALNTYVNFYFSNFDVENPNEIMTQNYLIENIRSGDVFYDVGANLGGYIVWIANAFDLKQLVAFEPEAANYSALVGNMRLNKSSNVICLPLAASNISGYDTFWTNEEYAGNASGFSERYSVSKKSDVFQQIVRTERIDDLIQLGIVDKPDVLLIDVDGGELLVLEGMTDSIAQCRIVIVEVAIDTADEVDQYLKGRGFSLERDAIAEFERHPRRGNRIYKNTSRRPGPVDN